MKVLSMKLVVLAPAVCGSVGRVKLRFVHANGELEQSENVCQ